jgi:hypothetical protein
VPNDLTKHNCIGIRQGEEAYGVWRLTSGRGQSATTEAVKTRGSLTTNDGEIAVSWALDGHGILMRAEWDIERYLKNGRLVQVLPQFHTPDADIHAVYPQRHQLAARVRAFVDFIGDQISVCSEISRRHPPRCQGSAQWTQVWNGRGATAPRGGSSCAGRSASPSFSASNACRNLPGQVQAPQPSPQGFARTAAFPGAVSRECGSGRGSRQTSGLRA